MAELGEGPWIETRKWIKKYWSERTELLVSVGVN